MPYPQLVNWSDRTKTDIRNRAEHNYALAVCQRGGHDEMPVTFNGGTAIVACIHCLTLAHPGGIFFAN